jgi:DNA-binding NtrC family response regulator
VLLDEIGEISPRLQVALLRVLEAGEVRPVGSAKARQIHCRIIAATNADLGALAERGAFREDLLFRLRRMEIFIPPLRERREDTVPLAEHFMAEGRTDGGRPQFSEDLRTVLHGHGWPGNARELRNTMERMRLLNSDRLDYGLAEFEGREPALAQKPAADGQQPAKPTMKCGRDPLHRLEKLRALFREKNILTSKEVIRTLGVSQATGTSDLKKLVSEGLVDKVMPTAAPRTHYFRLRPSQT